MGYANEPEILKLVSSTGIVPFKEPLAVYGARYMYALSPLPLGPDLISFNIAYTSNSGSVLTILTGSPILDPDFKIKSYWFSFQLKAAEPAP